MTKYVKYDATTGAAQMASTSSIFSRPLAVRRAASPSMPGVGSECTVKLTGSGGALEPGADELDPDIKTCHERTKGKPLTRVAVVLVNVDRRARPLTQQTVLRAAGVFRIVLDQRQRQEPQTRLAGECAQFEILT